MRTLRAALVLDPIEVPLIEDASDNLLGILSDIMKILFHLIIFHCVNVISILRHGSQILSKNDETPNEIYRITKTDCYVITIFKMMIT